MKTTILILALVLVSCVNERVLLLKETSAAKIELSQNDKNRKVYAIKSKIFRNNEIWACPLVTVIENQQAVVKIVNERYIPIEWSTPKVENKEKTKTFYPATPVFDKPTEFGVILKLSAMKAETLNSEKWVHLKGELICREGEKDKSINEDKLETLNNYAYSYSTDQSVFSVFLKDTEPKEWQFVSGKNKYTVKFEVSEQAQ